MIASGINVAGLEAAGESKKKVVYENKKRGGRKEKRVSLEPLCR